MVAVAGVSPLSRCAPGRLWARAAIGEGVARVGWVGDAAGLLERVHAVEAIFGRVRARRWDARILDLDLLARGADIIGWLEGRPAPGARLIVPHPRLHERRALTHI